MGIIPMHLCRIYWMLTILDVNETKSAPAEGNWNGDLSRTDYCWLSSKTQECMDSWWHKIYVKNTCSQFINPPCCTIGNSAEFVRGHFMLKLALPHCLWLTGLTYDWLVIDCWCFNTVLASLAIFLANPIWITVVLSAKTKFIKKTAHKLGRNVNVHKGYNISTYYCI